MNVSGSVLGIKIQNMNVVTFHWLVSEMGNNQGLTVSRESGDEVENRSSPVGFQAR